MAKFYLTALCVLLFQCARPQSANLNSREDSIAITLQQAEDSFLRKNLSLVAQKYSIDSAKATVITARLWDNPEFDLSNAFYNTATHNFFDPEENIQISQLIRLAGKRNKAINLAKSGIEIAQFQFYDLLRTLRYVLRNDFYNIYFLEQSSKLYDLEISSLQKLVPAFEEQVRKGYLAPIDAIRIKSQLYTLQAEYDGLQTNIDNIQSELKLLLRSPAESYLIPVADTSIISGQFISSLNYQELLDSAIANRPDLKVLSASIIYNGNNLTLQKAFAKPDITVGASYDRLGSYVNNFNAIGIGIPLPFFNRNQGNIKNAKIQLEQSKVVYESGIDKVKNDVSTNYVTALRSEKLLASFDPNFDADNRRLINEVTINFQKKNITMLEFLDFYNSYKQNVLQLNQLRYNKMSALEQLNFSTGKILFNP
ncbi:MAG: TolC family protein [Bacteroidota bacterium]|nr:TolC family protein [Bacteroidota bacterium]